MEGYDCDQDDLNNAILCVWKEARGDGHAAMNAVAHVIFNRIGAAGFASTLHEVIYGKNQFSSMSISTEEILRSHRESQVGRHLCQLSAQ